LNVSVLKTAGQYSPARHSYSTVTLLKVNPNAGEGYETMSKYRNLFQAGTDRPLLFTTHPFRNGSESWALTHLPQRVAQVLKYAHAQRVQRPRSGACLRLHEGELSKRKRSAGQIRRQNRRLEHLNS
jgi:hypothetical protein